jgi:hypothetical protein
MIMNLKLYREKKRLLRVEFRADSSSAVKKDRKKEKGIGGY